MFQAKTIIQAEIDTACELADFYRFNVQFAMVCMRDCEPSTVTLGTLSKFHTLLAYFR